MGVRYYPVLISGWTPTPSDFHSLGDWGGSGPAANPLRLDKGDQNVNGNSNRFQLTDGSSPCPLPQYTLLTEPLAAGKTITGTIQVCFPLYTSNLMIANYRLHVWVTQGMTNLSRGVLVDNFVQASGTNQMPWRVGFFDPMWFFSLDEPIAMTSVTAQTGDRIVVEVGGTAYSAAAGNSMQIAIGTLDGSGVELPDGVVPDEYPSAVATAWVEFVSMPVDPPPLVGTVPSCCDPSPVAPDPTGALPAWVPMCAGGGEVDEVSDLTDGEYWG